MYRFLIEELVKWKEKKDKKPLIIRGARQVGKTWLMKEFGKKYYSDYVYISLENNPQMKELFSNGYDISKIILGLEIYSNKKIDIQNTLLIFDEIQEIPQALTSLKYFYETAPEYNIICAGSLLGVALHEGTSFPVGKVEFLELYPLNFSEFLIATRNEKLLTSLNSKDWDMVNIFKNAYIELLKQYYIVGGMPEVVMDFVQNNDFTKVRNIQQSILFSYQQDFSKHAPSHVVPRIKMLWDNIPMQLSKENKKFVYGLIKEGARAREYELALLWLQDSGLIYKVHNISNAHFPLKAYEDLKSFKLFILDIGLLSCMTNLSPTMILEDSKLFIEFKGALTEQYVLQQLKCNNQFSIYYWSNANGNSEVDFVIDTSLNIIPIEVKANENLQAKSLKIYKEKYKPTICIRTGLSNYLLNDWILNIPLYAIGNLSKYIENTGS